MCFYRQTKRKKATEDIVVWKIMEPRYSSKYPGERRVTSQLYHDYEDYPEGYGVGDTIEAAWRYTKRPKLNAFLIDHLNSFLEGEVVHAYLDKSAVEHIPSWTRAVKLIIPAGNYYWAEDDIDIQIVSTSMIIQEIL